MKILSFFYSLIYLLTGYRRVLKQSGMRVWMNKQECMDYCNWLVYKETHPEQFKPIPVYAEPEQPEPPVKKRRESMLHRYFICGFTDDIVEIFDYKRNLTPQVYAALDGKFFVHKEQAKEYKRKYYERINEEILTKDVKERKKLKVKN